MGLDSAPQARLVADFRPQCQCQGLALSTAVAQLCNASERSTRVTGGHFSGQLLRWQSAAVPTLRLQQELHKEHREGQASNTLGSVLNRSLARDAKLVRDAARSAAHFLSAALGRS